MISPLRRDDLRVGKLMNTWLDTLDNTIPVTTVFPDCAVCDLSQLGLIGASGADTRAFLQGQLTNDVNQVTGEHIQFNSYCSPKGRMLASFWVFQRDDALYMLLPAELLPTILKRLQMFVLRADVTLEDASEELARFGLIGECGADLLPFAPKEVRTTITRDDISVIHLPGETPRLAVIGPAGSLKPLWKNVTAAAPRVGHDQWKLADIRAGIPGVQEATVDAFVPQMANLQLIDGVSFRKGCYTGQEVVSRMQYLGKLKRRMYRAKLDGDAQPAAGDELYSPGSEQAVGRIAAAAASPEGGHEVLAIVQIAAAEAGELRLQNQHGPVLELLDLPYAFETAGA